MVFFKDGLTEEELKKEYRRLAKIYHPDVSKDPNAVEIMKDINNQFDKYFTNQRMREFSWVDTYRAKREAQKVRATILLYLRRDKFNPGKFFAVVDRRYYGWFFWWDRRCEEIKGITDDGSEWDGFRGGFAYCSYPKPTSGETEVSLSKLPAKITPASLGELYWFNKDHWHDSSWDTFRKLRCRFGDFWVQDEGKNWLFYIKAELPEEFLKIGNLNKQEDEMYAARSIQTVQVNKWWVQEGEIIDSINGADISFMIYQDCSYEEFCKYHDVDYTPQFSDGLQMKKVRADDVFGVSDPLISFYIRKGIIDVYKSKLNYQMIYGTFNSRNMKENLHLMSIDDAEMIQDWLDKINPEFEERVKGMIKKGKIKVKIEDPSRRLYW